MSNVNQPILQLETSMLSDTMEEPRMYCKKVSKQRRFLTVWWTVKTAKMDLADLFLITHDTVKPRNTSNEGSIEQGSNGSIDEEEEKEEESRCNEKGMHLSNSFLSQKALKPVDTHNPSK